VHAAVHAAAARAGSADWLAWAVYMKARTASLRGEVQAALSGFTDAGTRAARLRWPQLLGYALAASSFYAADARDGDARSILQGRQAIRLFRQIGDTRGEVEALRATALALNRPDRVDEALAAIDAAEARCPQLDDPLLAALLLNARAGILTSAGRYAEAATDCQQCIRLLQKIGERSVRSFAHSQLGYIHLGLDQPADALSQFAASLELGIQIGDQTVVACMERNIALGLCRRGLDHQAVPILRESARVLRGLGDAPRTALTLRLLADRYDRIGDAACAAATRAEADRLAGPGDALAARRLRDLRNLAG
jgi:tetratricopeptide (TPR) repeat protein